MNNLSSYSGLVDAKIRASDKDLPVTVRIAISTGPISCLWNGKPLKVLSDTRRAQD